jgi:hypothetical protein
MNCRKFETIINDLARASVMDAEARMNGLAHAESCARCASRLADEKALTLGLRAMGAGLATKEAPARLEASLLAAFRASGASVETAKPLTKNATVVPMPQRTRPRWSWQAGAAVAAAILFAVTLSIMRLRPQQQPTASKTDAPQIARGTKNGEAVQMPPRLEVDNPSPGPDVGGSETATLGHETKHVRRPTPSYQPASMNRSARRSHDEVKTGNNPRVINAGSNAGQTEIATDFMPLTYDGGAMAMESGHVVRVELPRSALISMGLPMNPERAGELIKADVLMGDDGVARAIRFVR